MNKLSKPAANKYEAMLNKFWFCHDEYLLRPPDAFLYFYLLNIHMRSPLKRAFNRSSTMITAQLGISKVVLDNSRKKLKKVGLIDYKTINGSVTITWTVIESEWK